MLSASQIRSAYIAVSQDCDRLWDEVVAANREHGGKLGVPFTARQDAAYAEFEIAQDEMFRLERLVNRLEE